VAQPREHLDPVLLDPLAGTATVALLTAGEVGVDRLAVELEPGGKAGQDPDERRAVGLTRCREAKHPTSLRRAA
jgi:hypothetical protein